MTGVPVKHHLYFARSIAIALLALVRRLRMNWDSSVTTRYHFICDSTPLDNEAECLRSKT